MTDERAIEDRIRARAHEIWEREGRPEGRELRHWDEARLEVEAEERAGAAGARDDAPRSGSEAALASPAGEMPAAPDPSGEAARESIETEADAAQLDRAPM